MDWGWRYRSPWARQCLALRMTSRQTADVRSILSGLTRREDAGWSSSITRGTNLSLARILRSRTPRKKELHVRAAITPLAQEEFRNYTSATYAIIAKMVIREILRTGTLMR